ncbi:hypothetical protein KY345_00675 [Candidatus Woesearchaeota archaeon]|nr:hypothetical protein [Candidatus Woesearchaeota archaeon]
MSSYHILTKTDNDKEPSDSGWKRIKGCFSSHDKDQLIHRYMNLTELVYGGGSQVIFTFYLPPKKEELPMERRYIHFRIEPDLEGE